MSFSRLLSAPQRFFRTAWLASSLRSLRRTTPSTSYSLHTSQRQQFNTDTNNNTNPESTEIPESNENEDPNELENIDTRLKDKDIGVLMPSLSEDTPGDYSHIISEAPKSEFRRKLIIYQPARNAGQQGMSKTKHWNIQPDSFGRRWGNPLMGWTSTADPLNAVCNLDKFETKEQAVQFCITRGYDFEVREQNQPKRSPKNYAATFGKRGIPAERPTVDP